MNRKDLVELGAPRTYPAVSILVPTHRHGPENRQDPIRVRNLVSDATKAIEDEIGKRDAAPLVERLTNAVEAIDFEHTLDGLAIYATAAEDHTFLLPYSVPERMVIDSTFATRDLVYAMNRSYRYLVLVLSEQPTRLFRAHLDTLVEVHDHGFPMTHVVPGGATAQPKDFGQHTSSHRDERHRQFFRQVDVGLSEVLADGELPIVVVGVDRYQAFFTEVSDHATLIAGHVDGSHDSTPPHELAKLALPVAADHFAAERDQVLDSLEWAIGAKRFAAGIDEVRTLAVAGRGKHLLIEKGHRVRGRIVDEHVVPVGDDEAGEGVVDDVVDETIEAVLAAGGKVTFFDDGVLAQHGCIVLVTRY